MSKNKKENEFEEENVFNMEAIKFLLLALWQGVGLGEPQGDGWALLQSWQHNYWLCTAREESPIPGMNYEETVSYFERVASNADSHQLKAGKFWYAMYEMYQFYGGMKAEGGGYRWFDLDHYYIEHKTTWTNGPFAGYMNKERLNNRMCRFCGEFLTDEDFAKGLVGNVHRINANGSRFGYETEHLHCLEKCIAEAN